jgi:WD40 repeat protein
MNIPPSVDRAELPTQPPAAPCNVSLGGLAALLHEELHRRWVQGERPPVEGYLQRYPQLHANRDLVLALVLEEVLLRRQRGEQPSVEELAARFPDLAEQLRGTLSLEQFLLSSVPAVGELATPASEQATVPPQLPQEATGPYLSTPEAPARQGRGRNGDNGPTPACVPGYRVLGVLGKGGMGIVYRAEQTALRRTVALKMILHAEYAGEDEHRRFQAEAEAVAQLQHPNIVQVYEVGQHNGSPYFSLEFCSGGSLAGKLDGTPWEPRRAAALVQTLAGAMHAAHQADLVHRDLKPGNVLLTADGTPKVTDFGLVKRLDGVGQTQSGAVVGTPSYMAPEQASGKGSQVGPAADVYALGAILYELLTGRPPFKAATVMETIYQVLHQEPVAVRRLQPKVSRDIETICHKCLEKQPGKRYASAAALAEDLERFGGGEPVQARPVGALGRLEKWARRRPTVVGLLLLVAMVAMAGLGGILLAYSEAVQQRLVAEKETDNTRRAKEQADASAADAKRASEQAEQEKQAALEQAYTAQIARADADLRVGNHALALSVLDHIGVEHRGWEYGCLRRLAEGTPLTLRGHTNMVGSVAYSPDGNRLASASNDSVKVWDTRSGKQVLTLGGGARFAVFSPDGSRLATGATNSDHEGKVWDAHSGTEILVLRGPGWSMRSAAYSPDGNQIAAVWADGFLKVWDAKSGGEEITLQRDRDGAAAVCWSPDGSRIAVATRLEVKVRDARNGTQIACLKGHAYPVRSVSYSPDGLRIITGAEDWTVRIWDATKGAEISILRGYFGSVNCVSCSPDGSRIASGSAEGLVKVWDARAGTEVVTLKGHRGGVHSVAYRPDGARFASASEDGTIKIWDATSATPTSIFHGRAPRNVIWCNAGASRIATESGNPRELAMHLWDVRSGMEVATIRKQIPSLSVIRFGANGAYLATSVWDGTVKMWSAIRGGYTVTLRRDGEAVDSADISPDGTHIATLLKSGKLMLWDARTGTEITSVNGFRQAFPSGNRLAVPQSVLCYCPDGSQLAGAFNNMVKVWDAKRGTEVATLRGHIAAVNCVVYSPDGSRIATTARELTVKVWDANSGTEVATLRGHTAAVNSVAFSPDGSRIATASDDKTVKIWDSNSGTETATLQGHSGQVSSVFFTADGSRIFSVSNAESKVWDARYDPEILTLPGAFGRITALCCSRDGLRIAAGTPSVAVWDVRRGKVLYTLPATTGRVAAMCFSPDRSRLAIATEDKTVKVWDAASGTLVSTHLGHTCPVWSLRYSQDGSRLISRDSADKTLVWDAATGRAVPDDPSLPPSPAGNISDDGEYIAAMDGDSIRVWRRPRPGEYDPWEEDELRRRLHLPLWHAAEAEAAQKRGDAFAAAFHQRRLVQGENHLQVLAWARLADGDEAGCRQALQLLRAEQHDLATRWQLSAALTSGLPSTPSSAGVAVILGVMQPGRREELRLAGVLVRAAALLPSSDIPSGELVTLARSCVADCPQSWQARELLGAALYRDGKDADAIASLTEAVHQHSNGGSLWAKLFLALAHKRLGHAQEADDWQKKADKAGPWEEQVMQFQLLGEFEAARKAK